MERGCLPVRRMGGARVARRGWSAARRAGWRAGVVWLIALGAAHASPFTATAKPGPDASSADLGATGLADDQDLPVPPIPPDLPPVQLAPVPDFNAAAPLGSNGKQAAGLRPDVFRAKSYNRGDGYVNGSGDHDEGRFRQGPSAGFRLDVPLQ